MRTRVLCGLALAGALLGPLHAEAHLVTTGLGPVYDGIGHFFLTPEDLVPAVALALYAGLRGARPGRFALFILPAAWLLGGLASVAAGAEPRFPLAPVSFLALGVLVAANLKLPDAAVAALAAALGLAHGFWNGAALAAGPGGLGLVGIAFALFAVVALASALVVSLRKPWTHVAVRVTGSWIAAVGLLLLGWTLRTAH